MVDHNESGGKRFAGYIRVSSANQDDDVQRGIAAQKRVIQEFVSMSGSGAVVWYVDKGSGDALPALKALLADAGSPDRDFDTVLVATLSRLSRDILEFHTIRLKLREFGVNVVSIMEPVGCTPADRRYWGVLHSEDTPRNGC